MGLQRPFSGFPNSNFFAILVICLLGFLIYSNTFSNSFVYDDTTSIIENLSLRNIHNLKAIWSFWPTRFVTYLSFALNYYFYRLNVFSYHLMNTLIHLGSAVLVWWLVSLTFLTPAMKHPALSDGPVFITMKETKISEYRRPISFFISLIFVAHPIQTQAVTYIVQRAASLAGLFYLAALTLFIKSRLLEIQKAPVFKRSVYYTASLLIGFLGMFTKEMFITLPLMILLYDFYFLRTKRNFNWKYLVPFLFLGLIIPLTMLISKSVNFKTMSRVIEIPPEISQGKYLLTQVHVLMTYIRLLFLPLNQNLEYDYPISQSLWQIPILLSLGLLAVIFIMGIKLFSRYRLLSFGIFWFFLTLLPESSIIPIRAVIFEHRLYLPSIGYGIFLVSILYYSFREKNQILLIGIVLSMVIIYSMLTYKRNSIWIDSVTLWSDNIYKSPYNAQPYNYRGLAYFQRGEYAKAIVDYNLALKLNSNYAECYNNRANTYINLGEYERAIADCNQVLKINPYLAKPYYNRANIYMIKKEYDRAISEYNQAIKFDNNYVAAYNERGVVYALQGEANKAISDYTQALSIDPDYAPAYYNRGIVYRNRGEYDKARQDIQRAQDLGQKVEF